MIRVLHLTAHLGGGVGRALSGLVAQATMAGRDVLHSFVCFEPPERGGFIERIGGPVHVQPSIGLLLRLVEDADVVQLEWWNHPATLAALCALPEVSLRLVVWCHVSGLHTPVVPAGLVQAAHRFLFTSTCSLALPAIQGLPPDSRARVDVVASGGGFLHLPPARSGPRKPPGKPLGFAYVGTLGFSKLHPGYVDLVSGIEIPGLRVRMIGDDAGRATLESQARAVGKPEMFEFRGYREDVGAELQSTDVLLYLLNPYHYGTTENALLEAMALGIVPIVLDNPAERAIVRDQETGLLVRTRSEIAAAVSRLSGDPGLRTRLGEAAAHDVRTRFDPAKTEAQLDRHHRAALSLPAVTLGFRQILGGTPSAWFLACQEDATAFGMDGGVRLPDSEEARACLHERTKGSVFHYHRYFPGDPLLASWAQALEGRGC